MWFFKRYPALDELPSAIVPCLMGADAIASAESVQFLRQRAAGGAGGGIPNNGDVTVAVASEKALELFTPIDEREYVGYNGSLGRKGYDESVLAQYQIIDDPQRTATAQDVDAD